MGCQTHKVEGTAVAGYYDRFGLMHNAPAFGGQLVFYQFYRVADDAADRLIDCVKEAIVSGCLGFLFAAADQFHRRGGYNLAAGLHAEVV